MFSKGELPPTAKTALTQNISGDKILISIVKRGESVKRPAENEGIKIDFSAFGIADEQIKAKCFVDLDGQSNYRRGWLVLTEDRIVRILSPEICDNLDFTAHSKGENLPDNSAIDCFMISDCGELKLESQVASVVITLEYRGSEAVLAVATNTQADDLRQFVREYEKLTGRRKEFDFRSDRKGRGRRRPNIEEKCPKCGTPYRKGTFSCPKCNRRSSVLLRLLGFFKPYVGQSALTMLSFFAIAAAGLATPYLNGNVLYGEVLSGKDSLNGLVSPQSQGPILALFLIVLTMLAVKLLNQLFSVIQGVVVAKFVPFLVKDIKSKVFDAMSRLSLRFYHSKQTGNLMTRVLDDAYDVTYFFIDSLPMALIDGVMIVVAFIIMFSLNWKLTVAAMIVLPIPAVLTFFLLPQLWSMYGRRHRANRSMNSQINDNFTGARVVRAFGTEEGETKRFVGVNRRVGKVENDLGDAEAWIHAAFSIVRELITILVYAVGAWLILSRQGGMDYALLITFVGYVGMLNGPVETMSRFVRQSINCLNCSQRIFEIIDARPDVVEAEEPVELGEIQGEVALENVSFSYEKGKPVLKEVSLSAKKNQLLGVVGHSGAGKSTLLNLISRLYDVDEGRVTIDGVDIRDISFKDLHGLIAMVSQETYIFMGTVAENIAYAKPEATRDEIVEAAIAAAAHDFIMKLPDGYDTVIGSAGRELSGGERQRLSIARAILTDPKILILDEATASVDTETEIHIQNALEDLTKGRTTISVAHRLSTLRDASELVVLEDGRITERGTHDELIKQKGTYYRLAMIQSQAMVKRGISE